MRKIMLTALAAAAVLSGGAFGTQAIAMNAALPSLRAAANAATFPIERVRTVCGMSGCAPVFTKRIQKPLKFPGKAAPVVVTGALAPPPAPAAAAKPWPLSLLH